MQTREGTPSMPGTCVGVEATNLTGHPGDNHHDPRPTEAVAGFLAGAG